MKRNSAGSAVLVRLPTDLQAALSYPSVGFSITPEEIVSKASDYLSTNAAAGWNNLGAVISSLRTTPDLRWASPVEVKNAVEKIFLQTFGPREAAKAKAKVRSLHLL